MLGYKLKVIRLWFLLILSSLLFMSVICKPKHTKKGKGKVVKKEIDQVDVESTLGSLMCGLKARVSNETEEIVIVWKTRFKDPLPAVQITNPTVILPSLSKESTKRLDSISKGIDHIGRIEINHLIVDKFDIGTGDKGGKIISIILRILYRVDAQMINIQQITGVLPRPLDSICLLEKNLGLPPTKITLTQTHTSISILTYLYNLKPIIELNISSYSGQSRLNCDSICWAPNSTLNLYMAKLEAPVYILQIKDKINTFDKLTLYYSGAFCALKSGCTYYIPTSTLIAFINQSKLQVLVIDYRIFLLSLAKVQIELKEVHLLNVFLTSTKQVLKELGLTEYKLCNDYKQIKRDKLALVCTQIVFDNCNNNKNKQALFFPMLASDEEEFVNDRVNLLKGLNKNEPIEVLKQSDDRASYNDNLIEMYRKLNITMLPSTRPHEHPYHPTGLLVPRLSFDLSKRDQLVEIYDLLAQTCYTFSVPVNIIYQEVHIYCSNAKTKDIDSHFSELISQLGPLRPETVLCLKNLDLNNLYFTDKEKVSLCTQHIKFVTTKASGYEATLTALDLANLTQISIDEVPELAGKAHDIWFSIFMQPNLKCLTITTNWIKYLTRAAPAAACFPICHIVLTTSNLKQTINEDLIPLNPNKIALHQLCRISIIRVIIEAHKKPNHPTTQAIFKQLQDWYMPILNQDTILINTAPTDLPDLEQITQLQSYFISLNNPPTTKHLILKPIATTNQSDKNPLNYFTAILHWASFFFPNLISITFQGFNIHDKTQFLLTNSSYVLISSIPRVPFQITFNYYLTPNTTTTPPATQMVTFQPKLECIHADQAFFQSARKASFIIEITRVVGPGACAIGGVADVPISNYYNRLSRLCQGPSCSLIQQAQRLFCKPYKDISFICSQTRRIERQFLYILPCQHIFCSYCLIPGRNDNPKCPMCDEPYIYNTTTQTYIPTYHLPTERSPAEVIDRFIYNPFNPPKVNNADTQNPSTCPSLLPNPLHPPCILYQEDIYPDLFGHIKPIILSNIKRTAKGLNPDITQHSPGPNINEDIRQLIKDFRFQTPTRLPPNPTQQPHNRPSPNKCYYTIMPLEEQYE
ncbi:hypothetical protein NEHOM01_1286 [Nematocida homosporus]|uniref:uncharacterized protein n=1 Tax=Nematocida homosporus TaxID=1912981 RepID=UPI002220BFA0|nr:uncharacterized protein NEHOM01_1286 [Nematocida homosporus]KAI5186104.1 hypothetical protein NEHOM01_1286 [Nematocida homosporus]